MRELSEKATDLRTEFGATLSVECSFVESLSRCIVKTVEATCLIMVGLRDASMVSQDGWKHTKGVNIIHKLERGSGRTFV